MRALRNESGVAMVTVLFVGAVLTVVVSMAAFVTVQEFRSGADDRRSGRAISSAEAGVDQMMNSVRNFLAPWRDLVLSGCTLNGVAYPTVGPGSTLTPRAVTLTGTLTGGGTYTAVLRPLNPANPGSNTYCPTTLPSPKEPFRMKIISTGTFETGRRVIEQEISMTGRNLPIGVRAHNIDANGNPSFTNTVLISTGTITGRDKMDFSGVDPYYDKSDFYPGIAVDGDMPASAHSADKIYERGGRQEHPPSLNCAADKRGTESAWDGSILGGTITGTRAGCPATVPPTSRFTPEDARRLAPTPELDEAEHAYYREVAKTYGLYCSYTATFVETCTKQGVAYSVGRDVSNADVAGLPPYYVTYFDFAPGTDPFRNILGWSVSNFNGRRPCSATPITGAAVVIVRNGSLNFRGGAGLTGAMFAEDGTIDAGGSYSVEGTLIAKTLRLRGSPSYCNSQSWVEQMPGPFINVTAGRWTEVDAVSLPTPSP